MTDLTHTLTAQAVEHLTTNEPETVARYGQRHKASLTHAETLVRDRVLTVFTVAEWHALQTAEDRKEYTLNNALESVARMIGESAPKTIKNASKLRAFRTPELALDQIEHLGFQCTLDTCTKVGAVPLLKVAEHVREHLTNRAQDCTRYFKRHMELRQAEGYGIVDAIKDFNTHDKESLKELHGKEAKAKVDKELYDRAVAANKALLAEVAELRTRLGMDLTELAKVAPIAALAEGEV